MQKTSQWLSSFKMNKNAKIMAVCSGKGGVGKTAISLRLAHELVKLKKNILLIDCDFNLSNTSVRLRIPLNNNFLNFLKNPQSIDQQLIRVNGFDLLPAGNALGDILNSRYKILHEIINLIAVKSNEYDIIMLDCPAGASRETCNLAAIADYRMFVMTPDPASITDGYSLFKLIVEQYGCKNNLLAVNQVQSVEQAEKCILSVQNVVRKYINVDFPCIGYLPQIQINHQDFDQHFLTSERNTLSEFFLKIANNINEQVIANCSKNNEVSSLV